MTNEPKGCDELGETVFDITKPGNGIKFLGLLDSPRTSDNKLTGLFDWTCPACGISNRDAVVVETHQSFLGNWFCAGCSEPRVVRFQSRANTDWIAGHTLAVTGSALCNLGENDLRVDGVIAQGKPRGAGSQRVFALISIPVLIMIVVLGLSSIRPLLNSSAALSSRKQQSFPSTAVSRLLGSWMEQDGDDQLYFGHIDPLKQTGRYIYFPQARTPGRRGWFSVVHEDATGEQLVIRHWSERSSGQEVDDSSELPGSEVMIHIPLRGRSMTWVGIQAGGHVLKTYRRADDADILSQ